MTDANTVPQVISTTIPEIGTIDYCYNEKQFMDSAMLHINSTYKSHYSGDIQTTQYIMSKASSLDFLKGSVFSYIDRFGKKEGANIDDLKKAVHFIAMMAYYANKIKK